MNWNYVKVVAGLLAGAVMYMYYSIPNKIVVDNNGNIDSLINEIRASMQGNEFWKDQLNRINSELDWQLGGPQRQAKLVGEMNQIFGEFNQSMEETYRNHPEMRPSAAKRQAEALRERADQIEQQEFYHELEKHRLDRIKVLRNLIPLIKSRTK